MRTDTDTQEQTKLRHGFMAKDRITGFAGVVLGITTWIDGRRTYVLQSPDKQERNNQPTELTGFEEYRLEPTGDQDEPVIPVNLNEA